MFSLRSRPADSGSPQAATFTVFAVLWAAGTIFHIASYNQWGQSRALVLACAAALIWPRSALALSLVALLQVVFAFRESPYIPNHYLFAALVNATILLAGVIRLARRQNPFDGGGLVELSGPAVRIAVVCLYGFVVLHKLNADFFDPVTSCGAMFYQEQRSRLPWLPDSPAAGTVSIALALGLEAAIPLLLLWRRTRHAGILTGALFHWFLGLNPIDRFYNFSALLLALFALFASPTLLARWLEVIGERAWVRFARSVLVLLGAAAVTQKYFPAAIGGHDPFLVLWAFYGLGIALAWWVMTRRSAPHDRSAGLRLTSPALVVLPLLVIVNGFMPYLGLKTETSWAMFSNLRTEGGRTNHFVLPADLQVFDYQRQLVKIHASSDRYLQSIAARQQLIPLFEVRRRQQARVALSNGDDQVIEGRVSDVAPGEIPYALGKLLMFRPVDADGRQRCHH